jgi:hypothetical protein
MDFKPRQQALERKHAVTDQLVIETSEISELFV